ncbi:MAG: branched-chain amino acid ABC transporter substrate-binding protein [Pseudohongiella sp.]|nr:branched-chain amino acid ABC transporter substrate-binding protein [Pseudohongiella sp.]
MVNLRRAHLLYLVAVLFSVLLALMPARSILAQNNSGNSADINTPIDVAIAGPMVGTSFAVGIQFRTGVHAAIQHLTEGTLLGRPIRITEYNDACSREIAEKLALDLVQSPPAVVIGHSCSATTLVTAPIYTEHGVVQISPASTAPAITEMGISTLFRMIGRDDIQGRLVADRIMTRHAGQKIGLFRFATEYSVSLHQAVTEELARHGIDPTLIVDSTASATSYLDEIMQLMEADIGVLFIVGGGLDSGVIARQSKQIGATYSIIASDTLVSTVFSDTAGEAGDGIPFMFPSDAASLHETDRTRAALAAIRAMGVEPHGFTLLSYAAAEVWLEGVNRAGSTEAEAVAAAIRQAPMLTVLGTISFDGKGDIQTDYPAYSWFTWREGQRVPVD